MGAIPLTNELQEVISLMNRFRALKAEMDLVHQAWQAAVREHDVDRQVRLNCLLTVRSFFERFR
jgi:hypothetical protein